MSKITLLLTALACALGLVACGEKKQETQEPKDQVLQFNPKSVEKFKGEIVQLIDVSDPVKGIDEVGILLRTDRGDIPVHLGPRHYVLGGPVRLKPGMTAEVKGSVLYIDGRVMVIAREVELEDHELKLRDKKGNPLWSGWEKD